MVRAAAGDIVVFDNSDAVPAGRDWLAELVRPLLEAPGKARASFANQLPRADARALVRKDHERAFGDGKVQATWRFFFSLASAATWKRLLEESPFDEAIRYSEDVEWAWRNSRREREPVEIVYCPRARVEHSHNYTLKELARRFRGEGTADRAIFGDRPPLAREVAGAARETLRDWAWLAKRPRDWGEIPAAPVRRLVQRVSHWRGTREVFP
jgi:rhamnosyltransferase